mgnify:CR=1 FL=1
MLLPSLFGLTGGVGTLSTSGATGFGVGAGAITFTTLSATCGLAMGVLAITGTVAEDIDGADPCTGNASAFAAGTGAISTTGVSTGWGFVATTAGGFAVALVMGNGFTTGGITLAGFFSFG